MIAGGWIAIIISHIYERKIRIYENGLKIFALRLWDRDKSNPQGSVGGELIIGPKKVTYEDVVRIHPSLYSQPIIFNKYWNALGLRIILSKKVGKNLAADIILTKYEMQKLPIIIKYLKLQMGDQWRNKYKPNQPLIDVYHMKAPENIEAFVNSGYFSRDCILPSCDIK